MSLALLDRGQRADVLITFSGLDGAGKSTLISGLASILREQGRSVTVLTMYDHVGLFPLLRALSDWWSKPSRATVGGPDLAHRDMREDQQPGRFIRVVTARPIRKAVCVLDLLVFRVYQLYFEILRGHVLIMDRFFYDTLADIADGDHWGFERAVLRALPIPDLPILLDVEADTAFARKGEYSPEYLRWRLAVYKVIFGQLKDPVLLRNDVLEKTLSELDAVVTQRLSA